MKKIEIALVALLAVSARAQNTFPSNGSVGIGTTSPLSALTLAGVNSTNPNTGPQVDYNGENITFENTNGAHPIGGIKMVQPTGYYVDAGDMVLSTSYGGLAEKMRVTALGNVGIGTVGLYSGIGGTNAKLAVAAADDTQSGLVIGNGTNPRLAINGNSNGSWTAYDYSAGGWTAGITQSSGNVGIGTTTPGAKLDIAGSMKLSGGGANITFPDGTNQSTAWNGTLCGGDYSESVDISGKRNQYEPGDVLVVDSEIPGYFHKASEPYSMAVSGIYATKPGLVGRRQTIDAKLATTEIPMAMVGIVPTKVSAENGAIRPGDVLVSSTTPGYAMKGTDRSKMIGAIIGKALGNLGSGTGVIEVLVSLQ